MELNQILIHLHHVLAYHVSEEKGYIDLAERYRVRFHALADNAVTILSYSPLFDNFETCNSDDRSTIMWDWVFCPARYVSKLKEMISINPTDK